jgi:hypothetical protein
MRSFIRWSSGEQATLVSRRRRKRTRLRIAILRRRGRTLPQRIGRHGKRFRSHRVSVDRSRRRCRSRAPGAPRPVAAEGRREARPSRHQMAARGAAFEAHADLSASRTAARARREARWRRGDARCNGTAAAQRIWRPKKKSHRARRPGPNRV